MQTKELVSAKLTNSRKYWPVDFSRKPRSLGELRLWKGTEFRSFLLYSGLHALRNQIPSDMYKLFCLLSMSIRILCNGESNTEEISDAEKMLKVIYFVLKFLKEAIVHCNEIKKVLLSYRRCFEHYIVAKYHLIRNK